MKKKVVIFPTYRPAVGRLHLPPLPTTQGQEQTLCGEIKSSSLSENMLLVNCKKCLDLNAKQSRTKARRPKLIPKGFECVQCRTKEGFAHKMSCDPPYRLRKTDPDMIEQLIEVSDQCLTLHPQFDGDKILERPCNCRANVKKILRKAGIRWKAK
jgi:hypothetical protein